MFLAVSLAAIAAFGGDSVQFDALRRELRAFYPDECHGATKSAKVAAGARAIRKGLDAYAAAHPGYDALDLRCESYRLMREHAVPVLFDNLPFYFELGVNGGWSIWDPCVVPSRNVNRLCEKFYDEKKLIPADEQKLLSDRMGGRLLVCCGPFADDQHHLPPFHSVLTKGFGGIRAEVVAALAKCPADDAKGRKELETALDGLDTVHAIQLKFHEAAKRRLEQSNNLSIEQSNNLRRIIDASAHCPWEPPRTFFEGLNALWFIRESLGYVDGVANFSLGHPDAWFEDLYRADLAAGRLTKDEAHDLIAQFLIVSDCHLDTHRTIDSYSDQEAEMPLTLGGCDAEGQSVYNDLTTMFLEEHLRQKLVFPKLHCRISRDAPEAYLEQIGDMLMQGHAVFALFNDDRHIPNFEALGIPTARARDYVCCGCWDGNVDTETDVDAANYMSVVRILEMTIHRDPEEERRCRVRIDPIDGAKDFAEVEETLYRNFIRFMRDALARYTKYGRANAEVFPHPTYSMCLTGCLDSRRDTTDGGTFFRPRVVTLAFMANVVDSLCAIRKLCFEDGICTLPELLAAVRTNWAGETGERLRLLAMDAPCWGDNTPASNDLMRRWIGRVSDDIKDLLNDQGGPYVLACWIYREFVIWGEKTRATPDGRHDGDRLAQGFAPSEYRCKSAATTVMNAISSVDHARLYASNANLMFDKTSMNPTLFAAIFRVSCQTGMHLLQPNCTSVEDLLDAQVHPERHQDLIVKVCGYSARFISLSKRYQDEVIARHRLR